MEETILKTDFADAYLTAQSGWQAFLEEARADMEFSLLCQYNQDEWDRAERQKRTLYTFDKTQRQLNLLEGYEQRNRHILKIGPTEGEDDAACRQFTALVMHFMAGGRGWTGYDVLSSAFKWGNLATGSNLVEFWKDRDDNLNLHRWGYNSFLLDPALTKPDLSDCRYVLKGQWLHSDTIKRLLPQDADIIDGIPDMTVPIRWPHLAAPMNYHQKGMRLYEEWWRRKTDFVKIVRVRPTGEEVPFKKVRDFFGGVKAASDWVNDQRMPNGMPLLTAYTKPIDKIILTIFINNEPVWDNVNPLGLDDYNFVWFHGEWVPECSRSELKLQPFVRGLRDPQRVFNRQINQAVDIVESQIQSGKIVRDKHLKNYEDVYKSGQGVILHVEDKVPDSVSLTEILKNVESVDIRPGLFNLMELVKTCITEVKGLNNEIFGSDDKDIPGILHRFRTGAALTGQQGMFSGYRESKRCIGVKAVRLMQRNYDIFKVRRITNEWPAPGFYREDFNKYDCTPMEGMMTETQKQLSYLELKMLMQELPILQQLVPPSWLLKNAPIVLPQGMLEVLQQAERAKQQQDQLQLQNQQRINALIEAQTAADVARAKEDISDIQEGRANTMLMQAKTLVELQKLRGDSERERQQDNWQRQLDIVDRKIELEKIRKQKSLKKKGA